MEWEGSDESEALKREAVTFCIFRTRLEAVHGDGRVTHAD